MALTKAQQELLTRFGGRPIQSRDKYSLQMCTQGKRNTGKTHFSMTGRGPILLVNIDMGTDDVEDHIIDTFGRKDIGLVSVTPKTYKDVVDTQKSHEEAYFLVKDTVTDACKNGFRTIVLDTSDQLWKIFRIGYFGTDRGVAQLKYEIPNAMYSEFLRIPQSNGVDFITTHRVSNIWEDREYENSKGEVKKQRVKTEMTEREGFDHTDYIFRVDIEHMFRPTPATKKNPTPQGLDFGIRFLRCTANCDLYGTEVWQSDIGEPLTVKYVAQLVYPKSTPEDWD